MNILKKIIKRVLKIRNGCLHFRSCGLFKPGIPIEKIFNDPTEK